MQTRLTIPQEGSKGINRNACLSNILEVYLRISPNQKPWRTLTLTKSK